MVASKDEMRVGILGLIANLVRFAVVFEEGADRMVVVVVAVLVSVLWSFLRVECD